MSGQGGNDGVEAPGPDLSEVLSLAVHEINNYLNGIVLQVGVMQPEVSAAAANDLVVIRRLTHSAAALVKRLQKLNNPGPKTMGPADLNRIILEFCAGLSPSQCAALELHLADELPAVSSSASALERLVKLLIHHCLSLPAAGVAKVIVRSERHGAKIALVVDESGPAVPKERMPHLFDPFVVIREGADDVSLAVCEMLARRIEAKLFVESREPFAGLRFTLELGTAADREEKNA